MSCGSAHLNERHSSEVYKNIATMLTKLGDKYTRFLAPAQYTALMNSAQGELTGVGLELQVTGSHIFNMNQRCHHIY